MTKIGWNNFQNIFFSFPFPIPWHRLNKFTFHLSSIFIINYKHVDTHIKPWLLMALDSNGNVLTHARRRIRYFLENESNNNGSLHIFKYDETGTWKYINKYVSMSLSQMKGAEWSNEEKKNDMENERAVQSTSLERTDFNVQKLQVSIL